VTATKKPAAVEETNLMQFLVPLLLVVVIASIGIALFVRRRVQKKEEPVVVYAPPGYRPGDELAIPTAAPSPQTPDSSVSSETSEPVATVVATAPSSGGPAPMEAIPFAEPIAPSAGGSIAEAAPVAEEAEPAPFVRSSARPPTSYTPPPKSGLSPREPYAEQMWRKRNP
jgi:hypothetical protein